MASPNPAKRRRLDQSRAAHTLSKPFVSPLKSVRKDGSLLSQPRPAQYAPSALAHETWEQQTEPLEIQGHTGLSAQTSQAHSTRRHQATPHRHQAPFSSNPSTAAATNAPDEIQMRKQCTALELQIKATRNDIDMLKQARTIIDSDSNDRLRTLGQKWRKAAQEAADVVFETAKERIADMGGVKAWRRDRRRATHEREEAFGDGVRFPGHAQNADSDGEEFGDGASTAGRLSRDFEQDVTGRETLEQNEEGEEDDSFDMGMMLRSMNIDLEMIGFDENKDEWV